jgi:hypothetical protein
MFPAPPLGTSCEVQKLKTGDVHWSGVPQVALSGKQTPSYGAGESNRLRHKSGCGHGTLPFRVHRFKQAPDLVQSPAGQLASSLQWGTQMERPNVCAEP